MSDENESGTALVPAQGRVVTTQQIEDAGLLMPLADPAALRAAFAERQRVLTSILDPDRDFLYSVRYVDRDNKPRTSYCQTLAEAQKTAAHVGGSWSAHPKKSGVLKLAHALGIESTRVEVEGLPKDPKANYSSCRYVATHRRTNRKEEGQGYCDKTERANMQNHAIISMADTRAFCHAVLRCAGYDNVGAESMDGLGDDMGDSVTIFNALPAERDRPIAVSATMFETPKEPAVVHSAPVAQQPAPIAAAAPAVSPAAATPAPPAATTTSAAASAPAEGVITNAMAAELSALLLSKLGSKERARAWLTENAGVERSIHVKDDQIGSLTKLLNAMETP